jgi:plasmid stabilization system protein ParE
MQVVWEAPALRDLASLRAYIAGDRPAAAERQVERIVAAAARLAEFPENREARPPRRDARAGGEPHTLPYGLSHPGRARGGAARAAALAGCTVKETADGSR